MTRKTKSKLSWRKRLLIAGAALFSLYLCFGVWVVPTILISQIQSKGSEAVGREISVERATFNPLSFEVKLYGVKVGPESDGGEDLLALGKVELNPQLSSVFGTITIKSIELSEGDVWVEKGTNGSFNFQDILDSQSAAPASEADDAPLPAIIVEDLLLSDLELHFVDSSLATPYRETVGIEVFQGRDIGTVAKSGIDNTDTATPAYHWDFDGKIVTQSGAELHLDGGAIRIAPWSFVVNAELIGFPLASVQAYVDESAELQLEGLLGFKLNERVGIPDTGAIVTTKGSLTLTGFSASDSEQVFAAFDGLSLNGVSFDASSMDLSIEEVALDSPAFSAILLEDGNPRLPSMKQSAAVEDSELAEAGPDFSANIKSFVVSKGRIGIEDRSLANQFKATLSDIDLKLSDLKAAQTGDAYDSSGKMELALKLLGGDLHADAALKSLAGLAELTLDLKGIQLSQLQPYLAERANAELHDGVLDVSLAGSIQNLENPDLKGSLQLHGLRLKEIGSEKEIAAVSSLSVEGLEFSEDTLRISSVKLDEPLLAAWQDQKGMNLSRITKLEAKVEQKAGEIEGDSGVRILIDRFEVKSAGAGFVDTTLVSTLNSRLSDFDLSVDSLSTDPEALATFEFSGTVDGSARISGGGKLKAANPSSYFDLDMNFRGYDLTSTSPYWATYLGRELSKGQFEIKSHYEVRDDMLEGSNDFKIDQLTLGEKVQSERAINLPLKFAINLMKDPNGMIAYEGLRVEGDLSDPQVKPWGLIGRAVRNLMLSAVASPFKFLAKMAGGREDLDSVSFAIGAVEPDADALDKIAAIRKYMVERPGLNLEVAFLPDPVEKPYLEKQYVLHRLANPEFQVVSGLDLLRTVDERALEDAVRKEYTVIAASDITGPAPVVEEELPTKPQVEESPPPAVKKKGVVQRLAGVLGIGKSENEAPVHPAAEPVRPVVVESVTPPAGEAQLPAFDVMLAAVLDAQSKPAFNENWLNDLAEARILNFKTALLENDEIDRARVFATEVKESDATDVVGAILIRLAE